LTYGWWLNQVYTYNDPDHLLLEPVSDGENRARITSGVITGIFMNGDDLSYISGIQVAKDKARKFLTNEDINVPIHFNQINALYETPEHLSWVYKPAHFS